MPDGSSTSDAPPIAKAAMIDSSCTKTEAPLASKVASGALDVPLISKPADSPPPISEKAKNEKTVLRFQEVGVWTVMQEASVSWSVPGRATLERAKQLRAMLPFVYRFLKECFGVAPWMLTVYLITVLWSGTESAVGLYFSSRLLDIMQHSIMNQQVDRQALITAVVSRVGFTLVNCVVARARQNAKQILSARIRYLFEARLIQANLQLDMPTFEEPEMVSKINKLFGHGSRGGAWEIFDDLIDKLQTIASITSQLSFIFGVLRAQPGGFWFAMLCLVKCVLDNFTYDSFWSETSYVWDSNPHYRRMASLVHMVTQTSHRVEIVSDVLINYIQREWAKARDLLGDTSDDYPDNILRLKKPIIINFIDSLLDDFPLIFYAFQVMRSPGSFSLTSVALMQQASSTLGWTIMSILNERRSLEQRFNDIKTFYETGQIKNKLEDGELKYPQDDAKHSSGMEIKFENVSFAYPNAESVLKDVSFTIGRGQTVVIVGVNGSGKSTLLKLFNRLYDPTAGTVSVDGVPMRSFTAADVRRASAMLFQNYSHYPLPIRENISLGLPDLEPSSTYQDDEKAQTTHDELVKEAARLGGSTEVIEKQSNGFDTVLKPRTYSYSTSFTTSASEEFQEKMKEISKWADVSLGQWQRLALSRLFFRAAGKEIKLVAVDEPSASLDPKMEYELFERLRELSTAKGKTMVFVTHRFGYLTKRADLILVMQNGRLVQQGKHNELLEMGGEYAKLYNLQAEAFLPSEDLK